MLGGHVRRFCGDASVLDMSVTLLRNHPPPNDASPNLRARTGIGVGEDAAKLDGRCSGATGTSSDETIPVSFSEVSSGVVTGQNGN